MKVMKRIEEYKRIEKEMDEVTKPMNQVQAIKYLKEL